MCIVSSNFRKCVQFVGRLFKIFTETTTSFYIPMLFYPILASLNKNIGKEVRILCWPEIKKLHFSGHCGSVKVGVKQKKFSEKTVKITKLTCFVLMKSWSKYVKQNKTLKLEFSEKTSRQFVAFLIISDIKNGRLSFELKRFLLRKKLFFYIWKDQGGFDKF